MTYNKFKEKLLDVFKSRRVKSLIDLIMRKPNKFLSKSKPYNSKEIINLEYYRLQNVEYFKFLKEEIKNVLKENKYTIEKTTAKDINTILKGKEYKKIEVPINFDFIFRKNGDTTCLTVLWIRKSDGKYPKKRYEIAYSLSKQLELIKYCFDEKIILKGAVVFINDFENKNPDNFLIRKSDLDNGMGKNWVSCYYDKDFFEKYNSLKSWNDLMTYSTNFKKEFKNLFIKGIDFDKDKNVFEILKKINKIKLHNFLFKGDSKLEQIRQYIFSNDKNSNRLKLLRYWKENSNKKRKENKNEKI